MANKTRSPYQEIKKIVETNFLSTFEEQLTRWEQKQKKITVIDLETQLEQIWKLVFQKTEQYWIEKRPNLIKNKKISEEISVGKIYEYFLHHQFTWKDNHLNVIPRTSEDIQLGKVYTPFPVTNFISQFIIQHFLHEKEKKSNTPLTVADIACGTGRFLFEFRDLWESMNENKKLELYGFDTDPEALRIAQKRNSKVIRLENIDVLTDTRFDQNPQFDIIIGNPPYIESRSLPTEYWESLREKFTCAYKRFDLSVVFLQRIWQLLKIGGWAGLIITNKWMASDYGEKVRDLLLNHSLIHAIIDISHLQVIQDIATYPVILFFQKTAVPFRKDLLTKNTHTIGFHKVEDIANLNDLLQNPFQISQDQAFFLQAPKNILFSSRSPETSQLLQIIWDKLHIDSFLLGDLRCPYELHKGIHTGNVKNKLFTQDIPDNSPNYKHAITSRYKVERYKVSWQGWWINYDPQLIDRSKGEYGSLRNQAIFEVAKNNYQIVWNANQAALDFYRYYANNSLVILIRKPASQTDPTLPLYNPQDWFVNIEEEFYYLLGLLNSEFISYYYKVLFYVTHVRGDFLQYYIKDLEQIPLIIPTAENFPLMKKIASFAQNIEQELQKTMVDEAEFKKLEQELNESVLSLYQIPRNLIDFL